MYTHINPTSHTDLELADAGATSVKTSDGLGRKDQYRQNPSTVANSQRA